MPVRTHRLALVAPDARAPRGLLAALVGALASCGPATQAPGDAFAGAWLGDTLGAGDARLPLGDGSGGGDLAGELGDPAAHPGDQGCGLAGCHGDADGSASGDATGSGDDLAADLDLAGDDQPGPGDAPGFGDPGAGDQRAGDPELAAISPSVAFTPDLVTDPYLLGAEEWLCVRVTASFILEGRAHAPWRARLYDAHSELIGSLPADAPGELAPSYLGGGLYSDSGLALVTGDAVSDGTAFFGLDVDGVSWLIHDRCRGALLRLLILADGVDGASDELDNGASACPLAAPWLAAVLAPPASRYQVFVFDHDASSVDEYDHLSLPQEPDGLIPMPPLPTDGRLELDLIGDGDLVVESATLYLACG